MKLPFFLTLILVFCISPARAADTPDTLSTLRPDHPRILLNSPDLAQLKKDIADPANPKAAIAKSVIASADKILNDPKNRVSYTIVGPRLLSESRRLLESVTTLSMAHLLTGEKKYADLAISEMLVAGDFKDWNPRHFLDTAEMTAGMATGYDWLFGVMTDTQKKSIRAAIIQHGLMPGRDAYTAQGDGAKYGWWTKVKHNWSQVCNGGLAVGALAIANDGSPKDTDLARLVLTRGLECVKPAYAHWDADGGWDEGPGYWGYTSRYTAFHMAALQSATGSMHGLDKTPGLENAGRFRMLFCGPSNKTFNFADAPDSVGRSSEMFFYSRTFNRPEYAWHHRQEKLGSVLDLIWYDPRGESPDKMSIPSTALFRGVNVAFLRTDWSPDAMWVGLKGGDNAANHSHLDLGTFVLDFRGKRFAIDLGSDEYNAPGYFGKERYTFYRLKTEGHNTLVINGENQPVSAKARIIAFDADQRSAVIDLTDGYPAAKKVLRGIRIVMMQGTPTLYVQDEVTADKPVDVASYFHTSAKVDLHDRGAKLSLDGQTLELRMLAGDGKVTVEPVDLKPPMKPTTGISRIAITPPKAATVRLAYWIVPPSVELTPARIVPLSEWPGAKK